MARSTATRRAPRQARARDKVERILAAARRLLETEGTAAFNTNRIARDAGVGIGSVYEYFPDKQAIVDQLIDQVATEETDAILARFAELEGRPVREMVRLVIGRLFELYQGNAGLLRALWALSTAERTIGDRLGERQIMEVMRSWLTPLAPRLRVADVDLAVFTTFHIVEALATQLADSRWPPERCVDEITAVVERYLGL